ncbi:hypothetical protein Mal48_28190 [Thalassoglobus polymorphus]|uniref:Uncharacterized protein n=2 Tax=Thalassoglobus polymorphus TaxID=2527994 RepID=A0A517QPK8_9PLAN|nr:hypothetical protein Mal48_28190 [Thalassoglobus polymorphus]
MFKNLIRDESGFVVSTELVIIATILVIGMLVGLTTIRDQVVTELADVADAISALDQSYAFSDITGHASSTAGTMFDDEADFCDASDAGSQGGFVSATCIFIDGGLEVNGAQIVGSPTDSSP